MHLPRGGDTSGTERESSECPLHANVELMGGAGKCRVDKNVKQLKSSEYHFARDNIRGDHSTIYCVYYRYIWRKIRHQLFVQSLRGAESGVRYLIACLCEGNVAYP